MNISSVDLRLNARDLMSIINDFVKIDGLSIGSLIIGDRIFVEGIYKNIVKIPFKAEVSIAYIQNNVLALKLEKTKISKIPVFKFVTNYAMKLGLKKLDVVGISNTKNEIKVDLNKIFKKYPFLNLELEKIYIEETIVKAQVKEVSLDISRFGETAEVIADSEVHNLQEVEIDYTHINKVEDGYNKGRDYVKSNMPQKIKCVSDYVLIIPDIISLIYRLLKETRVSGKTKAVIISSLAYLSLPIDIIPDKIPFIGKIDDVGIVFFTLNKIINDVPMEILLENWAGKNDFVFVLKEAVNYLTQFTAADNVDKIYKVIDSMVTV
ncbi:YkvA family protein [Inconstantimicrobium mannanitabidum]|uniref:Uncharacterized protein n=1 Tax=Inconstantimicrobium mannanitabidum TaxID=1604901 RepID=A0ACB5RCI0_9CLOT|nr:DUF1232 domain-containing protein [Clostridium sp. TW13]GKX66959.1 hypothetical protein rsdtw13_22170 [Clostridium sp. TW13]